jgi:putative tryptophan/tyrosine transport system substrate-binding protein
VRRRHFLSILGGAAASWSAASQAQQSAKRPIVGFIVPGTPESHGKWVAAFTQRLAELGWVEGQTVLLEYRWAAGHAERYPEIAAELAGLNVDVFVTSVSGAVAAAKRSAPNVPIVYTALTTGSSFIVTLAHPGGTVTGLSQMGPELGGKRLEIFNEIVPGLRRLAILGVAGGTNTAPETASVTAAAQALGIEIIPLAVRQGEEIAPAIASVKGRVEALYVIIDPFISVSQRQINTLALEAQLPTMHGLREYVVSGGLASYGASFEDLFRRAGDYVDKILRGAKPADLPVEQPTKFDLVINLATARVLGLTVPQAVLVSATEVID